MTKGGASDSARTATRPRSWAEIDGAALAGNLAWLKARAPGGQVLTVLKADAYGHGSQNVARIVERAGATMIGVGDSTEALELRAAGISAPILILGSIVPLEIPAVIQAGIVPVVHSRRRVDDLEAEAARQSRTVSVHLKVDTGMGRLGLRPSSTLEVARRIRGSPHLRLQGLMSHLAHGGADGHQANSEQMRLFASLIRELRAEDLLPPFVHVRNSAGIFDPDLADAGETMVRAGAALYGFSPSRDPLPVGLRPVLTLRTQLIYLKDVPKGQRVGYGGTALTERSTRLGIIPLGYHDGMKRSLSNRGEVLIHSRRARVLGMVSMDYTTLDLTDVPMARVGDTVTIIGRDGEAMMPVEEVALAASTIPYDVLCGLGRRIVRVLVPDSALRGGPR